MYGDRSFSDKFMRLPDGRIAFFTEKKTWSEVLMNGLPLDEYLQRQTYIPKISFEFKTPTRRQRKHKESLNDEERCDRCNEPLDTMTFVTRQGRKKVFCTECFIHEYDYNNIEDEILIMQNHIEDINAILHLLDGEDVVSIAYFYIHIKYLVDTWKSYIGNEVIERIFDMMNSWSAQYDGDVNILKLVENLRILKKLLNDEMIFLDNVLQEDEPW
jgi:ribosomal protein L34E